MRYLKYFLVPLLLLVAMSAKAQTTTAVQAAPFTCVNQYSFYCYNVPISATVNGQSMTGTMTLDIFHMSYGYVSFTFPGTYIYAEITAVQIVSMNSLGQVTRMNIGFVEQSDPDADSSIQGALNLSVSWTSRSSGGGRGSHNLIWLPTISGPGSYTSD